MTVHYKKVPSSDSNEHDKIKNKKQEIFYTLQGRRTEFIMSTMKEMIMRIYDENGVVADFDISYENESLYGLTDYIREREETDEDYNWIDEFTDTVGEIVREKNLKRFRIDSDDDSASDFYYANDYYDAYRFVSVYTALGYDEISEKLYEN